MDRKKLTLELEPILQTHQVELDRVEVIPAGKKSVLRITVDGDGANGLGLTLDEIATVTRAISNHLDNSTAVGNQPFTLEVSTRGLSKPLEKPQHFRRNRGRLVEFTLADTTKITGRILEATDNAVRIETKAEVKDLDYAKIAKAMIKIEMNRADEKKEDNHEH